MSIVTRCPACATTFRVTPVQLQAQHGMVRCGRCGQVFDGFKTLATLPDPPLETPNQTLNRAPQTLVPAAPPAVSSGSAAPPIAAPSATSETPATPAPASIPLHA